MQLLVGHIKDNIADLAMYAWAVRHQLTQAYNLDELKLSSNAAISRVPYLLKRFLDASANFETRDVHCCVNGCLAFILKCVQLTVCNAYGEQRYKSNGKTAKQVTY